MMCTVAIKSSPTEWQDSIGHCQGQGTHWNCEHAAGSTTKPSESEYRACCSIIGSSLYTRLAMFISYSLLNLFRLLSTGQVELEQSLISHYCQPLLSRYVYEVRCTVVFFALAPLLSNTVYPVRFAHVHVHVESM